MQKASQLLKEGDLNGASKKLIEGIEINCDMIHLFIQELKHANVKFVVSPYESDAQLAHLYHQRQIDLVITEDSDLLAYGVDRVLFKMDPNGNGTEIDLKNINDCDDYKMQGTKKFDKEMLLQACIISGCDYHGGLPGIGYKTALQLVKSHRGDVESLCLDL